MQFATDQKSGKELSVLGFGCMRFPLDRDKAEKLVLKAVEKGVNYFDTAYIYGNSEATLGAILEKNGMREKVNIATKLPHQKCKTFEDFDKIFDEQLRRLKTGYIDYYLVHNISDTETWERLRRLGIERWIADKKGGGQVRQIGFSFHGAQNGFMELVDAYDWDFCMIQYNYMDENYQAGRAGLGRAYEKGLPVMIMEPLLGGKLATGLPPKAERLFKEADPGRSAAAWAFMWLWNQPGVSVVLSGMNSMEQLEENIKTAETSKPGMLSEKESAVFAPVMEALRESYKVQCTSCNYCMPCPQGVNIPDCFASYNTKYAMGWIPGMTQYVTSTAAHNPTKRARAKFCTGCKACEEKCPQHIPIAKMLGEVKKRMEPFWFNAGIWLIQKFTS
ncbi:MAG: aldo/keto reductase [Oscillospiraceae bacterium]|nr:aldo/keto reductase [Oscillospiraceae bacterium]